jgi:hypothetical protein
MCVFIIFLDCLVFLIIVLVHTIMNTCHKNNHASHHGNKKRDDSTSTNQNRPQITKSPEAQADHDNNVYTQLFCSGVSLV